MTRCSRLFAFAVVMTAAQVSSLLAADTVTRKSDGKRFLGTITDMSRTEFKVKKQTVGEPDVIQANDVTSIEWDGASPELRLGITDENGGKFESALQRFEKAQKDTKSPSAALKAEFDYLIARTNARIALTDSTKLASAITGLQAVQKASPQHFRYFESVSLLGQLQIAKGDFADARTTFELLAKAPWNDVKLVAQVASGTILAGEKKLDEAIAAFAAAAAAAGDSPADQVRKYEAMLGQARVLVVQTKYDDALKILEVVTDKGPNEETALQAEAYVLQGDAHQALGRMKEAGLAYLHVDLLKDLARESTFHAAALFQMVKVWKQVNLPDRSADAQAKLLQNYPNSSWAKLLAAPAVP